MHRFQAGVLVHGLVFAIGASLAPCLELKEDVASYVAEMEGADHGVLLIQESVSWRGSRTEQQLRPFRPWWITAGVHQEGPEKEIDGFTVKTFSPEQQAAFGIDELGGILDMEKFNAKMVELGFPELQNFDPHFEDEGDPNADPSNEGGLAGAGSEGLKTNARSGPLPLRR
eukprot:TRINITY_DN40900_c0_g1_i1.p2 TRINITY_DN40900_c0_g1~~TRINITY_DN40900_c0_g1_i1.p2  ORF type:complete len:171 (-),score=39.27 TRINITY_DN40900_c0_g1_i1:148-660(-)